MGSTKWKPSWWTDENHGSAWERVKEALHRDWDQTKKDLHLGGHELNQDVGDTVKQAVGKQPVPALDRPNPAKVIGDWDDVELPLGYGYAARKQYGSEWSEDVESKLRNEWTQAKDKTGTGWDEVKSHVRRGYDYRGGRDSVG